MIYFDNSATTCLSDAVVRDITTTLSVFGNPSSLHTVGLDAKKLLDEARDTVAKTFGLKSNYKREQIVFTSCGSEGDNLALIGTAFSKERYKSGEIITTDCEHPAVENTLLFLQKQGFVVKRIPTVNGILDLDAFRSALSSKTFLVSLMTVNNETGAWFDVERAFAIAKSFNPEIITHTDAVQGFLKVPFNPQKTQADMVTVSGHKIHAPKGVSVLYLSENVLKKKTLIPWMNGGGQENGLRSGTENVVGIHAMAVAVEEGNRNYQVNADYLNSLRDYAIEKLSSFENVRLHLPQGKSAPHILNFAVMGYKSETLVHAFSAKGVCVSSGSACSTHKRDLSPSLKAFGLTDAEIDSSIRLSFSVYNKKEEIDTFCDVLSEILSSLIQIKR